MNPAHNSFFQRAFRKNVCQRILREVQEVEDILIKTGFLVKSGSVSDRDLFYNRNVGNPQYLYLAVLSAYGSHFLVNGKIFENGDPKFKPKPKPRYASTDTNFATKNPVLQVYGTMQSYSDLVIVWRIL
uniref:Uncharacterized protein n=1 Tax=Panagrolaimus davidi TaxID=227884 RepID=A0A914PGE6_9BILA